MIEKIVESINSPYNREEDKSMPDVKRKNMPLLTLRDINKLKEIRNNKREEIAQNSVFIPFLYGPQENPEEGGMGGGIGF